MKTKSIELDVDYIGTQSSTLTRKEEKAISKYIRVHKLNKRKKSSKKMTIS